MLSSLKAALDPKVPGGWKGRGNTPPVPPPQALTPCTEFHEDRCSMWKCALEGGLRRPPTPTPTDQRNVIRKAWHGKLAVEGHLCLLNLNLSKDLGAGWGVVSPGVASGQSPRFECELCDSREMPSFLPLHFTVCKVRWTGPPSGCGEGCSGEHRSRTWEQESRQIQIHTLLQSQSLSLGVFHFSGPS